MSSLASFAALASGCDTDDGVGAYPCELNDGDAAVYDRLTADINESEVAFTLDQRAEYELCAAIQVASTADELEAAMWYRDPGTWRFAGRVEALGRDEAFMDNMNSGEPDPYDSHEGDLEDSGWLGLIQEAEDTLPLLVDAKYMLGFEQRYMDMTQIGLHFYSPPDQTGAGPTGDSDLLEAPPAGEDWRYTASDYQRQSIDPRPFNVSLPDGRVRVPNTTVKPWNRIVALRRFIPEAVDVFGNEGLPFSRSVCSGTMVGPRHVLTAAHCVWDEDKKKGCPNDRCTRPVWRRIRCRANAVWSLSGSLLCDSKGVPLVESTSV